MNGGNQEVKKITKPSTDMNTIPIDKMTSHIRDEVNPYLESIKSRTESGKLAVNI